MSTDAMTTLSGLFKEVYKDYVFGYYSKITQKTYDTKEQLATAEHQYKFNKKMSSLLNED